MSQKNCFQIIMQQPAQQSACIFIGQMPSVSQNTLFQIIWIFTHLQHTNIMICFQKKRIQSLQILNNIIIIFSKICRNSHRMPLMFQPITNRLSRIMWNRKWVYLQIIDHKWFVFLNFMKNPLRDLSKCIGTHHGIYGSSGSIDWNAVFS